MDEVKPQCGNKGGGEETEYDLPLHVAGLSIQCLVVSNAASGCGFPVAAKKIKWLKIPPKVFFACKHFGTGVLIATAFVHLLPTAFMSLGDPCLPDLFTKDYPPLPGVIMMGSLFVLFVIEMWLNSKTGGHSHGGPTGAGLTDQQHGAGQPRAHSRGQQYPHPPATVHGQAIVHQNPAMASDMKSPSSDYDRNSFGEKSFDDRTLHNYYDYNDKGNRLSTMPAWFIAFYEQYVRQHTEIMDALRYPKDGSKAVDEEKAQVTVTEYAVEDEEPVDQSLLKKMSTNITLLEGGILFHSVFVGMTVSITTEGFIILLVAISFHQLFEGLGLGSRIAAVPYPKTSIRPWLLVLAFGTTAPIGQAIGLLTRNTYDPDSAFGLIIVGVFNAMLIGHSSSGLLIYAALVDLLAEDFLSEEANQLMGGKDKAKAFAWVLLGALGMSIVGAFA
ncbi:Zinc-regulated transporter 2 [Metarhizium anisopliae]|nr:Zinc-regulated transporter 2 [Metarhizium anisopliae]